MRAPCVLVCFLAQRCTSPSNLSTDSSATVKNIVLTGFGKITLLDLDTIDISNLNRQFLFRKKDVKQSKSLVSLLPVAFLKTFLILPLFLVGRSPDRISFQPKRAHYTNSRQY